MIINLWSTPRTGSVWYSMHLAKSRSCVRITELFNPRHMGLYRTINDDGSITNHQQYVEGSRYDQYYLDNDNILCSIPIYSKRELNPTEEFEYRKHLLYNMGTDTHVVFHNHVDPIDKDILEYLTTIADENIYIYRKDRVAQIASYVIASVSKKFAKFKPNDVEYETIDNIPEQDVIEMIKRIQTWDRMEKQGYDICYEDIPFYSEQGMLYKQVNDYKQVLSTNAVNQVLQLLDEYGLPYSR
jgi:hypothetical protein